MFGGRMIKNFFLPLRVKLLFIFFLLSIVPVLVVTYFGYSKTDQYLEKSLIGSLKGISEIKQKAVESYITDRLEQIQRISESLFIIGKVASISELSQRRVAVDYSTLKETLNRLFGKGSQFEEVFAVAADGTIIVSTAQGSEGQSVKEHSYFIKGSENTFVQSVSISEVTNKPSMVMATPIKRDDGTFVGVLAARINLESLYSIVRDYSGLGESGETVMADLRGDEILILNPTRHNEKAALDLRFSLGDPNAHALQEATQGRSGQGFTMDYRGKKVLAVWKYMGQANWGIVTKIDAVEISAPKDEMRHFILLLCAIALIVVILLSAILSAGIVRPIKDLTEAANRISKGDMSVQLSIRSRDEIGQLAESFGRMIAAIKFLKEDK
jgi:nitrogen fixation/metabolism regulation signal transduction histidine kinase